MTTTPTTDTPEASTDEPFHLIADTTGEELEGMIPLMWCVQPTTSAWLADRKITQPHLLISVIHDAGEDVTFRRFQEMDRYIVPLGAGLEYIRFRRAGHNIVKATIIWGDDGRVLRRVFTATDAEGRFKTGMLDSDGKFPTNHRVTDPDDPEYFGQGNSPFVDTGYYRHDHVTEMTFEVSVGVFGKDSPKWEKQYFAKFTKKPVDECARRGRRMFFYPFLLLFLPFQLIVRWGGFLGSKALGQYRLDSSPLDHPFSSKILDIWSNVDVGRDGLYWFQTPPKKDDFRNGGQDRAYPFYIMNPITIVALWGILAFVAHQSHTNTFGKAPDQHGVHWFHMAWWQSLVWSIGIHLVILALVTLAIVVIAAGTALWNAMFPSHKRTAKKKKRKQAEAEYILEQEQKRLVALQAALATMTCDAIPKQVGLAAVPKERRTRHMKIQEMKSKVCRPFQA